MIPSFVLRAGERQIPSLPRLVLAGAILVLATVTVRATPIPGNLGNGLDRLVRDQQAAQAPASSSGTRAVYPAQDGRTYATPQNAALASRALSDDTGRLLVRVYGDGQQSFPAIRRALKAGIPSFSAVATDKLYRGTGVMDAYVALEDVPTLAATPHVAAVVLELRPHHKRITRDQALAAAGTSATPGEALQKLGTAFDQGVTQHRVDQINRFYHPGAPVDYEGAGLQIACISDSFNAHIAKPASVDVANFDLPGASDNPVNTTPVYVYLDTTADAALDDEGRGMCQIAYKMAPKAALAFGTADRGEVSFANVIRGLAGIRGYTNDGQSFAADTMCDDVGYFDEPFFQDGIIADGVDDASAAGVSYFSSAGNDIGTTGYDSDLNFIPNGHGLTAAAGNTALANTNIDLANVPANLYAGGFHNFNPGGAQDIAQTVNIAANDEVPTVLQWNEPYDQTTQPNNELRIWTARRTQGAYESGDTLEITPALTAGTLYELDEVADPGSDFDGIVTVTAPDGTILVNAQDSGVNEVVRFYAPVSGTGYTCTIGHYGLTSGGYTLSLFSSSGYSGNTVVTQISLLVFDLAGHYLPESSLTSNAVAFNEPIQLGYTDALVDASTGEQIQKQVQYVIARANVPAAPYAATHVRYLLPTDGLPGFGPAEYFRYTTVTTNGHATASTCNGTAAVSVFRPSRPEYYTSPGPATIYFDKGNHPLSPPVVRQQPAIAAADGGNVSSNMNGYFAEDVPDDPDTNGNFYGTSAAGPHAAAIAALVLEANGGRHSLTPGQMTRLLKRSTFPHDLDPNHAQGSARVSTGGTVTIEINSDDNRNRGVGENDNNAFALKYFGHSSVTSFVFNPEGTALTAGNPSGGDNGVTYSPEGSLRVGGTATYFEHSQAGTTFLPDVKPFTLGDGVAGASAAFSNPSSKAAGEDYTMTITLPAGALRDGQALRFGVGRGLARTPSTGDTGVVVPASVGAASYGADLFGGGVAYPEGTVTMPGMTFRGTTADGGTFSGTIRNELGSGYSPLDGYGFINAQAAVSTTPD